MAKSIVNDPIANRIASDVIARIAQGEWMAGALLPSRSRLAREYHVSLTTIQKAVSALVVQNVVRVEDKRGTFVLGMPEACAESPTPVVPNVASAFLPRPTVTVARERPRIAIIAANYQAYAADSEPPEQWTVALIHALECDLAGAGMHSYVVNTWPAPGTPRQPLSAIVTSALASSPDAVICVNSMGFPEWLPELENIPALNELPTVLVWDRHINSWFPTLFYDQWSAGYEAARHLYECGYERLHFLTPFHAEWLTQRVAGARAATRQFARRITELSVYPNDQVTDAYLFLMGWSREERAARLAEILSEGVAGNAMSRVGIIAPNDQVAAHIADLMRQLFELIPGRDYGLVGFDNSHVARISQLTTISPPWQQLSTAATQTLLRLLHGDGGTMASAYQAVLVPRCSTRQVGETARDGVPNNDNARNIPTRSR